MSLSLQKETMLTCPKCQQTYEEGSQRFCLNDGVRLAPAPGSAKSPGKPSSVFTNILGKPTPIVKGEDKFASIPRFVKTEPAALPLPNFQPLREDSFVQEESEPELETDYQPIETPTVEEAADTSDEPEFDNEPIENTIETPPEIRLDEFQPDYEPIETSPAADESDTVIEYELVPEPIEPPVKPAARNIQPSEVPSGTASVGDRKTNPTGRAALTWEEPGVLLGQSVKGRYKIVEILGQDETSIAYLAEDKIIAQKRVLVRVLMDEEDDDYTNKIYAEEIVSLSHINHPYIARVIDSGELLEGKSFIVSEYVEADSIVDLLKKSKQPNVQRTARIVRQVASALSEIHQNGILHRNLKPENILLLVSDSGNEQIKLTNFGLSNSSLHKGNLAYKAPEIFEEKPVTFASDVYSLAVIAYQMLTEGLPFKGKNEKELLKAQRKDLPLRPTDIRTDLPSEIDVILEKAMAFNPSERYRKARDFGDAFYNALIASTSATAEESEIQQSEEISQPEEIELLAAQTEADLPIPKPTFSFSDVRDAESGILEIEEIQATAQKSDVFELDIDDAENIETQAVSFDYGIAATPSGEVEISAETMKSQSGVGTLEQDEIETSTESDEIQSNEVKSSEDLWTRRSPEPPVTASRSWMIISILGLAVLLAAVWAVWSYSIKRQNEAESFAQTQNAAQIQQNAEQSQQAAAPPVEANTIQNNSPGAEDIEVPPLPRRIIQPPETAYFQNSKQNLKGDLLRNFLSFSLYYPQSWQLNPTKESSKADARGKFLDISKDAPNGSLAEQMLISYYDSKGIYKDDAAKFPQLVKETNETLKKLIPNYQTLSEGETQINGWKAYEVKFQGGGTMENGEKLIVWGRRIFIPAARPGFKSGYEITMLATSLSPDVKSVDDVGAKGDLATVLETFEPNPNF
jgi:serine/threonine protein kinase